MRSRLLLGLLLPLVFAGCATPSSSTSTTEVFGASLHKLTTHVYTVVLTDNLGKARIAVVPKFQGRVMMATSSGADGNSTGKINHDAISSTATMPKFSSVGGEERLSFGPEGGQFGLFFASGSEFTKENYTVPDALEKESFDVLDRAADKITLTKKFALTNYANKIFQMKVTRTIRILPVVSAWRQLGVNEVREISLVAYETENTLANFSKTAWRKEEGLPSISTVHSVPVNQSATGPFPVLIVPVRTGDAKELGAEVKADYPADNPFGQLSVSGAAAVMTGSQNQFRITVSPKRTVGLIAVYDPASQLLTIVQFMPFAPGAPYVDGKWEFTKAPYAGDAALATRGDGTIDLQTFSPALELGGWESATHTARTFHLRGKPQDLEPIAKAVLGVSILPYSPK